MRDCLERITDGTSRDRGSEKTNDSAADKAELIAGRDKESERVKSFTRRDRGEIREAYQ